MKNLIQYRFSCENAFFNYLKDKNISNLISKLKSVEHDAKKNIGGKNASLWFKFFKGDTAATTISDIVNSLQLHPTNNNHKYMIENFKLTTGLDVNHELRVFYS